MNLWIAPDDLRIYANLDGTAGRYADGPLGSNIRAAQTFIERETGRQFDQQNAATKTFTTDGRAVVAIPDLRTVTSATMQSAALTVNTGYWLIEDVRHSGVYVAVQLRAFGRDSYFSNPEWFDRNLDVWYSRGYNSMGLPGDLVITGDWGWASHPADLLHGVKAMAAWLSKRADAVLANAVQTTDGTTLYYSQVPGETQEVIKNYRRGTQAAVV